MDSKIGFDCVCDVRSTTEQNLPSTSAPPELFFCSFIHSISAPPLVATSSCSDFLCILGAAKDFGPSFTSSRKLRRVTIKNEYFQSAVHQKLGSGKMWIEICIMMWSAAGCSYFLCCLRCLHSDSSPITAVLPASAYTEPCG
jgi:hypothetical protein